MSNNRKIIKEDINFLEYPTWVIDDKNNSQCLIIEKSYGKYELSSSKGLPTHFDKTVLYYLLYKLYKESEFKSLELTTTRYEIAKGIFQDVSKCGSNKFSRIMNSLTRWKALLISFEGVFYENDQHTIRLFSILDDIILNTKTKELYIKFNQQYVQQMRETKFYKLIDFEEYKSLTRCVSARLYELITKNFKNRNRWNIHICNLAQKLTLEKRPNAQEYYPSDVFAKIKPALIEINEKTQLLITFDFDKETGVCTFKNMQHKVSSSNMQKIKPAKVAFDAQTLVPVLMAWGLVSTKARQLTQLYSPEKIKHKLDLLQKNKTHVKNIEAWLVSALEQDWDADKYQAFLKQQKRKEEQEAQQKHMQQLRLEHAKYITAKAHELYKLLPAKVLKIYESQYITWLEEQKKNNNGALFFEETYRNQYLQEMMLEDNDLDFKKWAKTQGHKISA